MLRILLRKRIHQLTSYEQQLFLHNRRLGRGPQVWYVRYAVRHSAISTISPFYACSRAIYAQKSHYVGELSFYANADNGSVISSSGRNYFTDKRFREDDARDRLIEEKNVSLLRIVCVWIMVRIMN